MDLIAPPSYASGRWVVVLDSPARKASSSFRLAHKEARARRRRRRLLILMLLAVAASAVAGTLTGQPWWEITLGLMAALALYVGMLLELKRRRKEKAVKVRPIRPKRRTRFDLADEAELYEVATAGGRRF